jgi:hypothetical protein
MSANQGTELVDSRIREAREGRVGVKLFLRYLLIPNLKIPHRFRRPRHEISLI